MCSVCNQTKCCCPEKRVSVSGKKGDQGIPGKQGPPGPAGPLSSIPVKNTVYVMKNGNDSTALVERLDKPFLTISAARAAIVAFYTGGNAPSASNRIRVVVYSGTYLESIILLNYVDWDLTNSVIQKTSGTIGVIDDNSVSCDSIVYGNATIVGDGALTSVGVVHTNHPGTKLTVFAHLISYFGSSAVDAIAIGNGIVTINSDCSCSVASTAVQCFAGEVTINGDVTAADAGGGGHCVDVTGGTLVINGDVTNSGGYTVTSNGCNVTINGNLYNTGSPGSACINCVTGSITLNGNATSENTVILFNGGNLFINDSRISCTTNNVKAIDINADAIVFRDVVIRTLGTGKSMDAVVPHVVVNYGIVASVNKGTNVTLLVGTVANNKFIVDSSVT